MKLHKRTVNEQALNRLAFHQEQTAMYLREIQIGLRQLKKKWAKEDVNWGHVGSIANLTDKLEDIYSTIKGMNI